MRLTLNYIPCSADLARTAAMPLAVILQPLALPGADDDPLQVLLFFMLSCPPATSVLLAKGPCAATCFPCCSALATHPIHQHSNANPPPRSSIPQ